MKIKYTVVLFLGLFGMPMTHVFAAAKAVPVYNQETISELLNQWIAELKSDCADGRIATIQSRFTKLQRRSEFQACRSALAEKPYQIEVLLLSLQGTAPVAARVTAPALAVVAPASAAQLAQQPAVPKVAEPAVAPLLDLDDTSAMLQAAGITLSPAELAAQHQEFIPAPSRAQAIAPAPVDADDKEIQVAVKASLEQAKLDAKKRDLDAFNSFGLPSAAPVVQRPASPDTSSDEELAAALQAQECGSEDTAVGGSGGSSLSVAQVPSSDEFDDEAEGAGDSLVTKITIQPDTLVQPHGWECGYYAIWNALAAVNQRLVGSRRGAAFVPNESVEPELTFDNAQKFDHFFKICRALVRDYRNGRLAVEAQGAGNAHLREGVKGSCLASDEIKFLLEKVYLADDAFFGESGCFVNKRFAHKAAEHICCPNKRITSDVIVDELGRNIVNRDLARVAAAGSYQARGHVELVDTEGILPIHRFNKSESVDFIVVVYNNQSQYIFQPLLEGDPVPLNVGVHWISCCFDKMPSGLANATYADSLAGSKMGVQWIEPFANMLLAESFPSTEQDIKALHLMSRAYQLMRTAYQRSSTEPIPTTLANALAYLRQVNVLLNTAGARFNEATYEKYQEMIRGNTNLRARLGQPVVELDPIRR